MCVFNPCVKDGYIHKYISINTDGRKYLKNYTIKRLQAAVQNAICDCNEDPRKDFGNRIYVFGYQM